jgi:hypothetical protein
MRAAIEAQAHASAMRGIVEPSCLNGRKPDVGVMTSRTHPYVTPQSLCPFFSPEKVSLSDHDRLSELAG